MLTKCANPACDAQFRYLHEGKLFILERVNDSASGRSREQSTADIETNEHYEYYWLCGTCSRSMVVVSDRWMQAQVLPG